MSILINRHSRVICQGMTGREGTFHTQHMLEYGTQLLAGVVPGRGGQEHLGLPMFDTVLAARAATDANVSIIFVPAIFAADAIVEAAEAGIELIVCITEHIPVHDMLRVKAALHFHDVKLIGPNTPGVITPGESKIGIMPSEIHMPGGIGIVSRSGTLTYEAVMQTTRAGLGQSTCVGIGGDPVHGLSFIDVLSMFEEDRRTKGMIMVGEIGGREEEEAAQFIRRHVRKPVVAYVAGMTAPRGRMMGHAGAIISRGMGTAREKFHALEAAGVLIVRSPMDMGARMWEFFKG